MFCAECEDVAADKPAVMNAGSITPLLCRLHEGFREIDADVFTDRSADQLEKNAVSAAEVGDRLPAGESEQRQHPLHPHDRMRIVLVDVVLVVNRAELGVGAPFRAAGAAHWAHYMRIQS